MSISRLKVRSTLTDATFYAALLPVVIAVIPGPARDWVEQNREAFVPLIAWLVANHWLRRKVVEASGAYMLTENYVEDE